jgi:hypothetical protein
MKFGTMLWVESYIEQRGISHTTEEEKTGLCSQDWRKSMKLFHEWEKIDEDGGTKIFIYVNGKLPGDVKALAKESDVKEEEAALALAISAVNYVFQKDPGNFFLGVPQVHLEGEGGKEFHVSCAYSPSDTWMEDGVMVQVFYAVVCEKDALEKAGRFLLKKVFGVES